MTNKTNSFKFYSNFLDAINVLPENERAQACYEFCKYGITGELPKDKSNAMFCVGVSVSVKKYQGSGGNHNPTGKNQWSKLVKSGQNGQNGQNEQTETETKIEKKYIKKRKSVVSDDWFPSEETQSKILAKGLDVQKVVEYFKGQCQAKGIEYVNFDKAILNWKYDESLKLSKGRIFNGRC